MKATARKFKKQHRGIMGMLLGILMGMIGFHEVDENGFEVDEFGNPIDWKNFKKIWKNKIPIWLCIVPPPKAGEQYERTAILYHQQYISKMGGGNKQ